jgi:hypothetical protein
MRHEAGGKTLNDFAATKAVKNENQTKSKAYEIE